MNQLINRFDAAISPLWDDYALPTKASIALIEAHFKCRLPIDFLEFSRHSKSYSSFFLSLGDDFDHHSHIIAKNHFIRTNSDWLAIDRTIPDYLIAFTENFMEDFFWCFDTRQNEGDYPVIFWATDKRGPSKTEMYRNFRAFIIAQLAYYEAME